MKFISFILSRSIKKDRFWVLGSKVQRFRGSGFIG
jgi:hypothetical protein